MPTGFTDILMITYNRPAYTQLALKSLLECCDSKTRVWVWHNGQDENTLSVVQSFLPHKAFYRFHHSPTNCRLREPTNWFWKESDADYLGKVDDDCLSQSHWVATLRQAHEDVRDFGVIACWGFMPEDFNYDLAQAKIKAFPGGHQLLQNFWVAGRGYLMKRECLERNGVLRPSESFTEYCVRLALGGWVNGWYYPLIPMDHFDDPRSPHTMLKTDDDLRRMMPLSVGLYNGKETTLAEWTDGLRRRALSLQTASIHKSDYSPHRKLLKKFTKRAERIMRLWWNVTHS